MSLRFTRAGDALVSASLDGTVREWSLTHHARHVAGQVDAQLAQLAPELRESAAAGAWREWAAGVLRGD
jgi:hypothetical protein